MNMEAAAKVQDAGQRSARVDRSGIASKIGEDAEYRNSAGPERTPAGVCNATVKRKRHGDMGNEFTLYVEPAYTVWHWAIYRSRDMRLICESVHQSQEGAERAGREFARIVAGGIAMNVCVIEKRPISSSAPTIQPAGAA